MSLEALIQTTQPAPPRIVVYGVNGIGKSSFAAKSPSPVFLDMQGRLSELKVKAINLVRAPYTNVLQSLKLLLTEEHPYQTVALDTLDALERKIWEVVKQERGKAIEDIGFNKGYDYALPHWIKVLELLDALRTERGMAVVLTTDVKIEHVKDPEFPPYDRSAPNIDKKAGDLIRRWADAIFYCKYKTLVHEVEESHGQTTRIAKTTGERLIHTIEQPAFRAKNSYRLPEVLPLEYAAFHEAFQQSRSQASISSQPQTQGV